MSKTAITELIEYIEKLQTLDAVINPMDIIKAKATSLLEKEKEQIIDAHESGRVAGNSNNYADRQRPSINYYNSKYPQP